MAIQQVTHDELKAIIDTDADDNSLDAAIATAIVTASSLEDKLTKVRLFEVIRWLSAHFLAMKEERGALRQSETGSSEERYGGTMTQGLNLTRYGQQAILIDTTGILAAMALPKPKARLTVV